MNERLDNLTELADVIAERTARLVASREPARLMDAAAVAELLAVPASWVLAEARAGRIPHVRLGRYVRFSEASLFEWAADLERGPTPYRVHHPRSDAAVAMEDAHGG